MCLPRLVGHKCPDIDDNDGEDHAAYRLMFFIRYSAEAAGIEATHAFTNLVSSLLKVKRKDSFFVLLGKRVEHSGRSSNAWPN